MNQTLRELRAIADRERARFLPEVTDQDLEKSGALFYMNGQNGTEFDWYVNDRLPSFMVFYNDKANLGGSQAASQPEWHGVGLSLRGAGNQAAKAGDTPGGVYRGGASRAGGAAAGTRNGRALKCCSWTAWTGSMISSAGFCCWDSGRAVLI